MILMQKKFPENVMKYVAILSIAGSFANRIRRPFFEEFVAQGSEFDFSQIGLFFAISSGLGLVFLYGGGILADKYGRRLTWAVSLLLYGGSMLWLAIAASSRMTLVAAVLMGISSALVWSKIAWLFDHEGRKGLQNAYGLFYIISVQLALAGIGAVAFLSDSLDTPALAGLAGVIILVMGLWVITFPENYGQRSSSLIEIAKSGINQFTSSRVLQLVVVQSIFIELAFWTLGLWRLYLVDQFHIGSIEPFTEFWIVSGIAVFSGVFIILLKEVNYRVLFIYPTGFIALFLLIIPFSPEMLVYILLSGIYMSSFVRFTGIVIFINDVISENRATALSFLGILTGIAALAAQFLGSKIIEITEVKWSFLAAGICAVVSLVLLRLALKMHESHE